MIEFLRMLFRPLPPPTIPPELVIDRKPRFTMNVIGYGAVVAILVSVVTTIATGQWAMFWLLPIQLAVAVMALMTVRLWDYSSRTPGTTAFDWRFGTDTVAEELAKEKAARDARIIAEALKPCPHCGLERSGARSVHGRSASAGVAGRPDPAAERADAIREAVQASRDLYGRKIEEGP